MINTPSINDLNKAVESRYQLVTAVAARARQLPDGGEELQGKKPVTFAVEEISKGYVVIAPQKGQ
ncbi:MAG: DNA-directed RNA polymerase subunit omega [Clostridiales bacterium]|nr:DNA-directed RNA polymerase subunit omega [Clostridiales bacterium]